MASRTPNTPDLEKSCVLCCQELDVYAVGKCDHPICYRCSTKMRVLCEQKYCAVCREELDKVVFIKKVVPFSSINTSQMQSEKKHDIYFSDGRMFALFRRLLQHECWMCSEVRPFHTFADLEQHMRKHHELFCCKLCVNHLKNFTYERKWYSRKDLARHRIHGDPEDTSHRGHPLCKFCDERYLDNDELLKHLRRDHYFCHFCDSDGAQEYYSDYSFLREHFRESHFLCEEGRCNTEQFTHAFRSEIDYKAHKTSCHSKNRAEARQNRQIDIQFSYAPRHNRRAEGVVGGEDYEEVDRFNRPLRGRGSHQSKRGSWRYKREEEDREVAAAVRASVAARRQEEMGRRLTHDIPDNFKSRKEEGRDSDEGRRTKPAPKPSAEMSGVVEGEEFEEVDRFNRPMRGRGSHQSKRGSWRYKREEEDREVAAAVRASVAARRQEEMGRRLTLDISDNSKSRKEEGRDSDEGRRTKPARNPSAEMSGPGDSGRMSGTPSPVLREEDFPAIGSAVTAPLMSMPKPARDLNQEDFPSLTTVVSSASVSSSGPPFTAGISYTASAKSSKRFQEDDFPALVSNAKPWKCTSAVSSAWASATPKGSAKSSAPPVAAASKFSKKSNPSVNKRGANAKAQKAQSLSEDEDDSTGITALEFRNAPTMIDISKLLTTSSSQTSGKISKIKRVGAEKPRPPTIQPFEEWSIDSFLKENSPTPPMTSMSNDKSSIGINGLGERKPPEKGGGDKEPPGLKKTSNSLSKLSLKDEDFPVLINKNARANPPSVFSGSSDAGKITTVSNGLMQEDSPATGLAGATPLSSMLKPANKDEDFPSLTSLVSSSSSMPPFPPGMSYTAPTKSSNAFQEDDFPALVTKAKPQKHLSNSTWTSATSKSTTKSNVPKAASKKATAPSSRKGASTKAQNSLSLSEDEDDGIGTTAQEFRSPPTMMEISKMLTAPEPQTNEKSSKVKRVNSERQSVLSDVQPPEDWFTYSSLKENARETERTPTPPTTSILSDKSNTVVNGFCQRKAPQKGDGEPPGLKATLNAVPNYSLAEEDFPALMNSNASTKPPPGFCPVVSVSPLTPPPGLASTVGKPPPGFSGVSSVPSSAEAPDKEVSPSTRAFPLPEDFQQRNIDLINSIRDYLHSDESKFNEFKSLSGKFRQGLISASEYYKNCRQLLGENFSLIFNELLVLLPDNAKQHELLAAHQEFWVQEKQTSNKPKKNKKTAWKTENSAAPNLNYSICPTCNQILAQRDVAYHKTLHLEDEGFPSLQAISRIIS
ncbi:E3 ubiquitin-protein ligase ZNF598 [Hyperolius riggenbachi]|uniref:E3 ubiquitin-protein ligase ZNF598 n=1 Tax=Hyperolius riggenbachi TaxID=752182 RepID=UPI0035A26B7A